jgi:hypothetical protein
MQVYNPGQLQFLQVSLGHCANSKSLGSSVLRARDALQHIRHKAASLTARWFARCC